MAEQTHIKVIVRVRPYNRRELEHNQRCIVKVMDDTNLLFDPEDEDDEFFYQGAKQNFRDIAKRVNKKLSMEFDRVFDTESKNYKIFEECTEPIVDSVLNGYNGSVFVYGATGAGKTYTMLGSNSCSGLTYLTMSDLFKKINMNKNLRKFDVGVSYLEVYNEQVINLLTKSNPLKLREDSHGVVVSGLVLKPIKSAEELLELLAMGNANRTQHPTDANSESSRSHAIFQVHIRMTDIKTNTKRTVKLSMIDLAGSERAASTKGLGLRFKEGANINKSLLALGNCINKLADGNKHIPYRDSNLTRILKDSLGGNCRTLMIANVSMSSLTYEDTYNTLKYASRAKKIRTILRQNVLKSNMPKEFYVRKTQDLLSENEKLKDTIKVLEIKLAQSLKTATATPTATATTTASASVTATSTSANNSGWCFDDAELKPWLKKIDTVYDGVIKAYEIVVGLQNKIKNIKFRTKLKQESSHVIKILTLDKTDAAEELAKFNADVSVFASQIDSYRGELLRWRKNLQESYKDLDKLKKELEISKFMHVLHIYLQKKDLEISYCKEQTNFNHVLSIIVDFVNSSEKLRTDISQACELLQKSYVILNMNHQLKPEMIMGFEQLRNSICCMPTKSKIDISKSIAKQLTVENNNSSLGLAPKRVHPITTSHDDDDDDDDSEAPVVSPPKRSRLGRLNFKNIDLNDSIDENDTDSDNYLPNGAKATFKIPKLPNPNETQILSSTDDESNMNCNAKSEISSDATIILSKKKPTKLFGTKRNLVNNILSEKIAHVAPYKKDQLKSVLLRSNINHQGILKAVATGVEKENKKYIPSRIRKSPRDFKGNATGNAVNIIRKQATRVMTNGSGEPAVRINRAASFRVKK